MGRLDAYSIIGRCSSSRGVPVCLSIPNPHTPPSTAAAISSAIKILLIHDLAFIIRSFHTFSVRFSSHIIKDEGEVVK